MKRVLRNHSQVVMFLFIALVAALLGVRSEAQDRKIRHQTAIIDARTEAVADIFFQSCLTRNANATRINAQNKAIYDVEKTNPFIDEKVRAQRLTIYGVVLKLSNCKRPALLKP